MVSLYFPQMPPCASPRPSSFSLATSWSSSASSAAVGRAAAPDAAQTAVEDGSEKGREGTGPRWVVEEADYYILTRGIIGLIPPEGTWYGQRAGDLRDVPGA